MTFQRHLISFLLASYSLLSAADNKPLHPHPVNVTWPAHSLPLTNNSTVSQWARIQIDGVSLQADTFYITSHPLKQAFFPSQLALTYSPYTRWTPRAVVNLPNLSELASSNIGITSQSQQQNSLSLSYKGEDFAVQSRYLHDDGYKANTRRDLINLALEKEHQQDDFSFNHLLLINSINQNDFSFIEGKNAYTKNNLLKANALSDLTNDAQQILYKVAIEQALDEDKSLSLTPYLRLNQTEAILQNRPDLPKETTTATSIGIQTQFSKAYSEESNLTTGFNFDYTYADYLQIQRHASGLAEYPQGKHYDFTIETLKFSWHAGIEQYLNSRSRVLYDIQVDKTHYFYRNYIDIYPTFCSDSSSCMFQAPDQRNLNFLTWTPSIALAMDVAESHAFQVTYWYEQQVLNSLDLYRLQQEQAIKDIEPLQTGSLELTFSGTFAGHLYYKATGYYRGIDNLPVTDQQGVYHTNQKATSFGIDFLTGLMITDGLQMKLGAFYTNTQYTHDNKNLSYPAADNQVKGIPRTQGFFSMDWQPTDNSQLGLNARHLGKYFLDNANTMSYKGHTLYDLNVQQTFPKGFSITAAVLNLTNKHYAYLAESTLVNLANPTAEETYLIGTPRAYLLSINKTF